MGKDRAAPALPVAPDGKGTKRKHDRAVADALRALVHRGHHSRDASRKESDASTKSIRARQPRTVEALMVSETMYLKDPDTMIVYSTERAPSGDLAVVGYWNGASIERHVEHVVKDVHSCDGEGPAARQGSGTTPRRGTLQHLNFAVTDPADHCETCVESYQDIHNFLMQLCKELGKTPATLKIYDPYFCTGTTKGILSSMGYEHVYNENEDFYEKTLAGSLPDFDILVTNPPFSGDHVIKLIHFVEKSGLPWALLMPTYVARKDYFLHMVSRCEFKPLYVVPKKRYVFYTPKGVNRGNKRFNKRGRTSPYVTMWFFQSHRLNSKIFAAQKRSKEIKAIRVYCNPESLPAEIF